MKVFLVAIAKNEKRYISEFINHHLNLGFDKIIIYDNNDKSSDECYFHLANEKVDVIDARGKINYQKRAYKHCYNKYKNENGWMFFLDIDEFLIIKTDIHSFLSNPRFERFNQILFNWRMMSDNNLVTFEDKPLLQRFTKPCHQSKKFHGCSLNKYVKCCVRLISKIEDIHLKNVHFVKNIKPCCNPRGKVIKAARHKSKICYANGYIKHFQYKTIEEFVTNRMLKGNANSKKDRLIRYAHFFEYNKVTEDKLNWLIDYIYQLQREIY